MQMNSKKTKRMVLDVALTAMIVAEMFIQFTGQFLHEIIGFVFFATVVVHLVFSAKWIRKTAGSVKKGRLGVRSATLAIVGILLALTMVVLGVSSIAISGLLADAGLVWTLGSYSTWAVVHAVSSYVLCAIVVVHLAAHWAFLAAAFRVPYNPERRSAINASVHAVAAVGAVALGVIAVREAIPSTAITATTEVSTRDVDKAFGSPISDTPMKTSDSANTTSSKDTAAGNSTTANEDLTGTSVSKDSPQADSNSSMTFDESTQGSSALSDQTSEGELDSTAINVDFDSEDTDASSAISGTCPLCRKNCPLSDPQCNRPYQEGLL